MSQNIARDAIISVLEKRFDHQSARNVLARASAAAGLKNADSFSAKDIENLIAALQSFATHIDPVAERRQGLAGGKAAPAAEPRAAEPKAAEPKAAEPKAADPKAAEPKAAEPKAAEAPAEEPKAEEAGDDAATDDAADDKKSDKGSRKGSRKSSKK